MVVGSVITHSNAASGFTFQPAATVEITILTILVDDINGRYGVTNGVNSMYNYGGASGNTSIININNPKMGITNTWYWSQIANVSTLTGFIGMQIK